MHRRTDPMPADYRARVPGTLGGYTIQRIKFLILHERYLFVFSRRVPGTFPAWADVPGTLTFVYRSIIQSFNLVNHIKPFAFRKCQAQGGLSAFQAAAYNFSGLILLPFVSFFE